jgi:S-formylglutathione hydrolase FrmB
MDAMLRDHLVQPMIVVAPDASGGWLHDSEMVNQVGGPQVETYLTRTVVRAVDGRYRTVAGRAGRAIGGMSSGAYGALNLGLRHQDLFSVILGEMPYGDPGAVTGRLLGGSHALWLANSPDAYLPRLAFHQPMAVDLLAGTRDPTRVEAGRLVAMLQARGQDAVDTVTPGANHTWRGAHAELPYALAFASQHLHVPAPAVHGPAR